MNELSKTFIKLISEKNFDSEPLAFKRYFLSVFCKEDKSNVTNLDYFLRNHKFENDETLLFTMVEDNSFENLKIMVLCS